MEKLARSLTIKYTLIQCAFWVSHCTIFSFAAVFLQDKNFSNTQIGVVLSVAAILSILLQPLVGAFADRSENITLKTLILSLMFIILISACSLLILHESFLLIALVYVIIISVQFTLASLMNSLALEYVNMGIPVNYGLARGISSVAFAIDSFLLGIATDYFHGGILLNVFLVNYIVLIYLTWNFKVTIPKELNLAASNEKGPTLNSELTDLHKSERNNVSSGILYFFIKYKQFTLFLIGVTMIFYSHNLVNSYMINIMENVGGSGSHMGLALSIAATLELPVMAAFFYLIRKIRCSTLLKFSGFFFAIKSAATWMAPSVGMVLFSQSLQMLAFAIFTPASIYYVNVIMDPKDRVKGQAMLGVANLSLVGAIGGITGGKILDTLGVSDMLLLGTVVTGIGALILYFSTEKTALAKKA
ncbi:MAG: major Facilitator Superfamily protein [Anaerocolumna sp.]|jgi:PPP family 3-phenylpropionic acid transporter|nr:major Facilitator Superfamily protein [Anaerocolumna sp.]